MPGKEEKINEKTFRDLGSGLNSKVSPLFKRE